MTAKPEPIAIRRHPIIIIVNLVALEFAVTILYFAAAVLGNYQAIYQAFTFSQMISYEIIRFLAVIIAETFLIAFIFLRWFFNTYSVYDDMVVHEWGIAWKRRRVTQLAPPLSISCHFGPLARIFKYGTLILRPRGGGRPVSLTYVPNPESYRTALLGDEELSDQTPEINMSPEELLRMREHEKLEFKSSFRWDMGESKVNKALERAAMKTVAAFMNSGGGHLMVGVGEGGKVFGLARDYETLRRPDADGFENHFTQVFNEALGPEYRRFVKLSFHPMGSHEVCMIKVFRSSRPAYIRHENGELFYIRTGNSTTALQLSEAAAYIQSRWRV